MRSSLALLLLTFAVLPSHAQQEALRSGLERFEALNALPGFAVAIVVGDEAVLVDGFGYADLETRRPFTAQTQHYIASSTKSFTGLAAALLDADGKLDLRAPIDHYLPDASWADSVDPATITLRDLLSHTHGLENDGPIVLLTAYTGDHTPSVLLRAIALHGPADHGRDFEYGNVGYNIASLAIDRALNQSWKDVEQDLIFDPLGMTSTTGYYSRTDSARLERAYRPAVGGGFERVPFRKFDGNMHAAGGLISTASDLERWLEVNLNNGVLDGESIFPEAVMREVHTPIAAQDNELAGVHRTGYGLGWNIGEVDGERVLLHHGGFPGFATHVSFMPSPGVGVAVLANEGMIGSQLIHMIADYIYDTILARPGASEKWDRMFADAPRMIEGAYSALGRDYERRAQRSQDLPHPRNAYTGTYAHPVIGQLQVCLDGEDQFSMRMGQLETADVEVYDAEQNALRTELTGSGTVVEFEFEGGRAVRAKYFGVTMDRVDE